MEFWDESAQDRDIYTPFSALKYPYSGLLKDFLEYLKIYFDLVSFVVYGSAARGDAKKDSDIDLLIIADSLPDRYERFKIFDNAEEKVVDKIKELRKEGYCIIFSPIIKSREEAELITPLYLDMVEDAVVLYDKDEFFTKIIKKLKKRLDELGAERIRLGRKWYWRLKKDYRFGEVIEIE